MMRRLVALLGTLLLLCGPMPAAYAEESAGKLLMARGQVTAVAPGGDIRPLERGDLVYSGETLSTGPNSSVRIRFSDGGFLFLRPGSRFRIDEYRNQGKPKEDKSVFTLLKGGFRSITGSIGRSNKESYKVGTPVATIGIRGTDHQGRYCAGDCIDLMNRGVQPPADGLYTGTTSGATVVGGRVFRAGQFGYTDPEQQTIRLPDPPPILAVDDMPDPSAGGDEGDEGEGGDDQPADDQGGDEPADDQGGDEPADDQGGDEPADDQGGDEPADDQGGDQPADDQGGDQPADDQGGAPPADDQGGDQGGGPPAGDQGGGEPSGDEVGGEAPPEEFEIPPRAGPPVSTDCVR